MVNHLRKDLEALERQLLYLAAQVEQSVRRSMTALLERRRDLATAVIEGDNDIDRREVELEEDCLKVLALHQPVATDLRFVACCLKINNDLERMGDLAGNIAKRVLFLASCERFDLPVEVRPMATRTQSMVKQSLDALVNSDTTLARKVREADDEVDNLRRTIEKEIEHQIAQLEEGSEPDDRLDPQQLDPLTRRYLRDAFREVAAVQRSLAGGLPSRR